MITSNPILDTPAHEVDEPQVAAELDTRLEIAGLFKVYREVRGQYLQPRLGTPEQTARIDRLLLPLPKLLDLGWTYGAIGIECKRPGKPLGPALSQCMDYSRAAFRTPGYSVDVVCRWVLLWPMEPGTMVGDMASIMDNNRIGGAINSRYHSLHFKTASCNLLTVCRTTGEIVVGKARQGNKTGSR